MTDESIFLNGELEAIRLVIRMAKIYGYGNLIGHLKRGWALQLLKNNPTRGYTYKDALKATDVSAYPKDFPIDYE